MKPSRVQARTPIAQALDADLAALGDRWLSDGVMEWEYLLVTARRA